MLFDPTGQNPSISIKETANVLQIETKKEKRERTDKQRATTPHLSSNSKMQQQILQTTQGQDLQTFRFTGKK
jgi:hypothetical protein